MANRTCYNPSGQDRNKEFNGTIRYLPCSSSNVASPAQHAMCCRTNDDQWPDQCRDDGLCYNAGSNFIWRESCTDPTWKSKGCIKLCIEESGGGDIIVSVCEDSSFCCGKWEEGARECCVQRRGVRLVHGEVLSGASSSLNPTSTGVLEATYTPPVDKAHHTSRNHTPVLVGTSIGGAASLILVIAAIWVVLRKRRRERKTGIPCSSGEKNVCRNEADGDNMVREMGGRNRATELEAPGNLPPELD